MAKGKGKGKGKKKGGGNVSVTIKNPPTRSNKKKPHKKKPKKNPHRRRPRRRNPEGFLSRLGNLALVAVVAVASGTAVTLGQAKIAPGKWYSLYGVPAAALLGGAALASVAPKIGAGVAMGAAAPWALPIASKALSAMSGTTSPAASKALQGFDFETLGAVEMGDEFYHALNAVTVGAVEVGAVEIGDENDDYEDDDSDEDELYQDASYG